MELGLKGKRALVTGSSSGLGEAIAKELAKEGAAVVVHGRDRARTEAVAKAVGGEVAIGDLATDAGAEAVARVAGAVDILVNNAGAYHHTSWSEADWGATYENNVMSGVRMIRHLVPEMRRRRWGRVITLGGGLAIQPIASMPDYNASLAARHNLAVSLARELKGSGVTSNVVAPGAIRVAAVEAFVTQLAASQGIAGTFDDIEGAMVDRVAPNDVGRFGRAEEVAAAVAFLASERAAYVSGAILRVDGGAIRSV